MIRRDSNRNCNHRQTELRVPLPHGDDAHYLIICFWGARKQYRFIRTLREVAGISQEELAERLDVKQPYISQLEGRENITLNTLVGVVVALGGSIDITINFPEKAPVSFSRIETLFSGKAVE